MATASEILAASADLIERTGWTQKVMARAANGEAVDYGSRKATCFCLFGALMRAATELHADSDEMSEVDDAIDHALSKYSGETYISWNDRPERTAAEVIALLREAAQ